MKAEGYVNHPDREGLTVYGGTADGMFYGAQTVKQLVDRRRRTSAMLHAAKIRDWPAMKYRGLDDDLSRGPITTLEFEKQMIRTIAAYKINLYSPYFEHTQQYASNPLMAPPGSVTAEEAEGAGGVCEALPHHDHSGAGGVWASAPQSDVGAVPATGGDSAWRGAGSGTAGVDRADHADVYGAGVDSIRGRFCISARMRRWTLGWDRRRRMWIRADWLRCTWIFCSGLSTALKPLNRKLLFWGDIAQDAPDLLKDLPQSFKDSTIAIAWVYNPEPRGYDRFLTPFTKAGFETWVAPSVNQFSQGLSEQQSCAARIFSASRRMDRGWGRRGS